MQLDNEEHRVFLLELFDQVNFPGRTLDIASEVKSAIKTATTKEDEPCKPSE